MSERLPQVSTRVSIAWLPDPHTEPTSTLVLTSPAGHFVDIRVLLQPRSIESSPANPRVDEHITNSLDWAFAGTSTHEELSPPISPIQTPLDSSPSPHPTTPFHTRGTWTHLVDSRLHSIGQTSIDSGIFADLSNGDSLERGRMVDPSDKVEKDYEEVWRDEDAVPGECWVSVLRRDAFHTEGKQKEFKGDVCGYVMRVGKYAQGVCRLELSAGGENSRFSAVRWEKKGQAWNMTFTLGDDIAIIPHPDALASTTEGDKIGMTNSSGKVFIWHTVERCVHG